LEGLIDEVERMSSVGEGAIGLSREQEISEIGWRGPGDNGREHGTLGRPAMAHGGPTPQPALHGNKIGLTSKRRTFLARCLSSAVCRYATRTVDQSEISLFFRQHG